MAHVQNESYSNVRAFTGAVVFTAYVNDAFFFIRPLSLPSLPPIRGCHYATCRAHVRGLIQCERANLSGDQVYSGLSAAVTCLPSVQISLY